MTATQPITSDQLTFPDALLFSEENQFHATARLFPDTADQYRALDQARPADDPLPSRPSALLRLAANDFDACIDDPRYTPRSNEWHRPFENLRGIGETCAVCAAGALMSKTLAADKDRPLAPSSFPRSVRTKLMAIDRLRQGDIAAGLGKLIPAFYIIAHAESDDETTMAKYLRQSLNEKLTKTQKTLIKELATARCAHRPQDDAGENRAPVPGEFFNERSARSFVPIIRQMADILEAAGH